MPSFESPIDSTTLFYRHYEPDTVNSFKPRAGAVSKLTLVFLHGWPMSSAMYEHLMLPLCETYGIRCIAPDRRGFGKSHWNSGPRPSPVTWQTFVDDTIELLKRLDVKDFVFVGASMGAVEAVKCYLDDPFFGERCKGFVFMGAAMPFPEQCLDCPQAPSTEYLNSLLDELRTRREEFVSISLPGIFAIEAGNTVAPKTLEHFEHIVAEADALAMEKTALILRSSTDKDLQELVKRGWEVPMLVLHGDSDAGMPVEISALKIKELVPWAEVKVYTKAGHGLWLTHASQVLEDIVAFVDGISKNLES